MTGYGSAAVARKDGTVTVEARSVNSRGLRVVVKVPPGLERWEVELRALAESRARRGRLDLFVRTESAPDAGGASLDEARVREVLSACARLRDEFGVAGEPDIASLLRVGGIFRRPGVEGAEFVPEMDDVKQAATDALDLLVEMRDREGARLDVDLRGRLAALRKAIDGAEALAPERLERERRRLRDAIADLAGNGLDEDRLAREIALIADRWEISEELVRSRSHVEAFEEFLEAPIDDPVGRRLGFLVQELQREFNTLGAKANDSRISRLVVEAKNEIERLREQVENVE